MSLPRILKVIFLVLSCVLAVKADYKIGVGISDITGPVSGINLMGYADVLQSGSGLHLRQFARAFILDDGKTRIVFVSIDAHSVSDGLRKEVLQRLSEYFEETYTEQNVIISGTHTHSGPGGFLLNFLFDGTILGFVQDTFEALTFGVTEAIILAHQSMVKGKVYLNAGELLDVNINRSPLSYLLNPPEERARYKHNVDKEMVQLKFVSSVSNKPLGVITWYAVHAVSMNVSNTLVSSDNLGLASILFENEINNGAMPGKGSFVAAFASSNEGDASPNIKGPRCVNTGEPCDELSSTCDGVANYCIAFGPGDDQFESTRLIAERLYKKAKVLWSDDKAREVTGPLRVGHQYFDMSKQSVEYVMPDGSVRLGKGCVAALGYSIIAGTIDGAGGFGFTQATLNETNFWKTVRNIVSAPSDEDIACHAPKPIFMMTGKINFPHEWQTSIVSIQAAVIGDVVIAAVPGEFDTMAGRRLRNALRDVLIENGGSNYSKAIIAGLSNIYADYVVTPEEYQLQRFEAAFTVFGPHTLPIFIRRFSDLLQSVLRGNDFDRGESPQYLNNRTKMALNPPVLYDTPGYGQNFGDCIQQPPSSVTVGDLVTVKFVSGHPRNNMMLGKTFLLVERLENGMWIVVATDASWETKFIWKRNSFIAGTSEVTIEWQVGRVAKSGTYRIRHFGYHKYLFHGIYQYEGKTNNFTVIG